MVQLYNSPTNLHERIKALRTRVVLHREMARQSMIAKGLHHADTIHHYDVLEELSAKLSREMRAMQAEIDAQRERIHDAWDICTMNRSYEL